jgi:diguanylate cyclase (GGDEF)-like protein
VQTYTDITARAAAEEMLEAAAGLDHLTGLCNRNGFGSKLEQALQGAQRGGYAVTVLCIDLDHFKIVNDTMGHEAGDALLRIAAQRMRDTLRDTDVIARLGGDEFAVVLSRHSPEGPEMVAQKLLDAIGAPFRLRSGPAVIGASIGIATYPEDGATPELLLRHADIALYQAKASGRMAWRVYAPEGGLRERRRFVLEQDLREAVAERRFTLSYQPICDLTNGDPIGFEALLRWNHPDRGAVSPLEFIPLAEETGLIGELQLWVIETACAEAATWARPAGISINVSPAWLRTPGAVESLRGVLARTGLAPARLALEVTEAVLLPEDDMLLSRLGGMRVLGARLVLDDFGTSPGSLGHLGRFAFDQVKIDRSFMRALNSDRQARALVEAMLAIAHARGLEVVAEGVETQEQLSMLRHLRCDYVQGFLLGHPQSGERTRQELWDMVAREGEALERRIV